MIRLEFYTLREYYATSNLEGEWEDVANFATLEIAEEVAVASGNRYNVEKRSNRLIVYESVDEYNRRGEINKELRDSALAKLTLEERLALGV